jgi:polar amino acid transport system substrate-binding protein
VSAGRAVAFAAAVLLVAGCGQSSPSTPVTIAPVDPRPPGVQAAHVTATADVVICDPEASLRPGPRPAPNAMPPGSTMAAIAERGRLVVGVDQNQYLFGFRNPSTRQLEGFDIDLAREIARAMFGDPDRIDLEVVDAGQRLEALRSGQVDLVVRTFSSTCERKKVVAFSTSYFYADQKILVAKGSGIDSVADLAGKRACAVTGTTSLERLSALESRPAVFAATTWTDCLVMLQQGQIDAIGTDYPVLYGLAEQDPRVEVVGPTLGVEPYGVGVDKSHEDLVRWVNGVLEQIREDGTWERLYDARLRSLGPSPGPPIARYED